MTQSEAQYELREFEKHALTCYETCDKRKFRRVLAAIGDGLAAKRRTSQDATAVQRLMEELQNIDLTWQKERVATALVNGTRVVVGHAGADGIGALVARVRKLIPQALLESETPPTGRYVDLSHLSKFADVAIAAHAARRMP